MDFFNQTFAQVRDLFASMTPGARVTAGLLLAVVVVSLGFLFGQAAAAPDEYLFGGEPIARSQLPRMEAAMSTAGITDFTVDGNRIRVPRSQKTAAIAAIADAGELPPDFGDLMDKAIDGGSMFDDRATKRRRIESAREAQASLIISQMPWVEQAHVMYNHREERGLRMVRHASAAVSVKPAVGQSLTNARIRTLKGFIASACDVAADSVSVTSLGNDTAAGSDGVEPEDFDHPYYALKTQYERRLSSELNRVLSYIPGVRIGVKAELDETESRRMVKVKPEEPGVPLQENTVEDTTTMVAGPAGNRPGVETNSATGPAGRDEAMEREDRTNKTSESADRAYVVGQTTEETVTMGFSLKEAEASIGVPRTYVLKVYRDSNRDADGAEPEQVDEAALQQLEASIRSEVENIVKPMLPKLSLGQDEYKQVSVEFFHDLPSPEIPAPSATSNALAWAGNYWDTMAMGGLAVFSLVMLRSMVSSAAKEPPGVPTLQLDGEALGLDEPEGDEPARPKLKLRKGDTLKEDLTDMVSNDPDAAAAILRSWINNAG